MCEERGGSLAHDATFGTNPFVMRADLIEPVRDCFSVSNLQDKTYLLILCMVKERAIDYLGGGGGNTETRTLANYAIRTAL